MNLNEILIELRQEKCITQQQLADITGIAQSTIAKIEIGRNEATASTLRKLATYFDVSADYLLGLEDETGARLSAPIAPSADPDEQKLVNVYRTLDDDTKAALWTLLNTWTPTTFSGAAQKKRIK